MGSSFHSGGDYEDDIEECIRNQSDDEAGGGEGHSCCPYAVEGNSASRGDSDYEPGYGGDGGEEYGGDEMHRLGIFHASQPHVVRRGLGGCQRVREGV